MAYDFLLSDSDKRELLRIARTSLTEFLDRGTLPPGRPHPECLVAPAAAFVTLRRSSGALRGCIGMQSEDRPLYRAVQDMAVAAATRDPRFAAVDRAELVELRIEISVLGAYQAVTSAADIVIGEHGLTIALGSYRGLLLPQVASDRDWTGEVFLANLCSKAGLASDAWQSPDARVQRFTAQVFDEDQFTVG